jgi:3-dehydroquinate dehydratase-1
MNAGKSLVINGQALANGRTPLICVPLVGREEAEVLAEVAAAVAKGPDLLEWRVDFFAGLAETARVIALAQAIRRAAAGLPLIFTRRSTREGGEPIALSEAQVLELYLSVIAVDGADFYDYELSSPPADFQAVRAAVQGRGAQLLASYHNFQQTPSADELLGKFRAMADAGADVVKIAVMPQTAADVLTLLTATLAARQQLNVPVISMSMGPLGAVSRLVGAAFGSCVSFAVGAKASAPGQVPVADLQAVREILQRAAAI